MALKSFVKVGNITNLSDARYCAGMGVDMLGFCVNPRDENYIDPASFKDIVKWVSGPRFVGEFSGSALPDLGDYNFSFLEHFDISVLDALQVDCQNILKISVENLSDVEVVSKMEAAKESVAYFLVEGKQENEIADEALARVITWAASFPVLLGYGITTANVHRIVESDIKGIALHGSLESKPGFKDYDELADILEALEADEYE